MITTRVQLRIVALFYFAVAVLGVLAIVTTRAMASRTLPGSIGQELGLRAAYGVPSAAATAMGLLLLSGLSLRFMALSHAWRIVAIVGSLYFSLLNVAISARDTFIVTPILLGPSDYGTLAVELSVFWGRALPFLLCTYLLWKQLKITRGVERP